MGESKRRVDEWLVEQGVCQTLDEARRWIMAGKVIVGDHRVDKASSRVAQSDSIRIRDARGGYVGRGGLKLEGAIRATGLDVRHRVVLDLGASTGGFTQCFLEHGARRVYAVDVGRGLLSLALRKDPRVVVLEGTHAKVLDDSLIPEPIQCFSVDVSFIGLRSVLPFLFPLLSVGADGLLLFKPQFEARREQVDPGGKISDTSLVKTMLTSFERWLVKQGFSCREILPSVIKGQKAGNQELFFWVQWRSPKAGEP